MQRACTTRIPAAPEGREVYTLDTCGWRARTYARARRPHDEIGSPIFGMGKAALFIPALLCFRPGP